ncbi:MAG: HAD family phosphatase [Spirochaetaceae bacterium]|jgi:HAD superfamily hydrolase (TIGR01509 family)|nr:HAD family phosphatase [Spirochaetaceae bacterium]
MMEIKGVLFDLDGLLVDTEKPFLDCWVDVCVQHGFPVTEKDALTLVGMGVREEAAQTKQMYGEDFPFEKLREETYRVTVSYHEQHGMRVMRGAQALLSRLKDKKIPICLATGTMYERTLWKLRVSGLEDIFDAITTGSDVQKGKPDPSIFLTAAQKISIAPQNCVGFEDSTVGLLSLHAAGIRSIFIKDIIEPPPDVLQTVWKRFNSLDEAIGLF